MQEDHYPIGSPIISYIIALRNYNFLVTIMVTYVGDHILSDSIVSNVVKFWNSTVDL